MTIALGAAERAGGARAAYLRWHYPVGTAILLVWASLFSGQLIYDLLQTGRLHPVSLASLGWTLAVFALAHAR